jgi:hypothetical protein
MALMSHQTGKWFGLVNGNFQYKLDPPQVAEFVRLGTGSRHSLVAYISIN